MAEFREGILPNPLSSNKSFLSLIINFFLLKLQQFYKKKSSGKNVSLYFDRDTSSPLAILGKPSSN